MIVTSGISVQAPPRRLPLLRMLDAVIALVTTLLCSLLVYHNLGKPVLTGIDDENITQVYGRNLANGFGYVYTPDFEHVEGATSPLWVAIHYVLFKVSDHPEPYIVACTTLLTALAIFWSLGIARCAMGALGLPRWALWIPVAAIAAQPNYFAWTVVAMMDQGLWGTIILGLVYVLIRQVSAPEQTLRTSRVGLVLCVLSVLTRPESILLLPVMLGLASTLIAVNRGIRTALRYAAPYYAAVVLSLLALTGARMVYFGYPLPNTYYAKVSSNPLDNVINGLHYIQSFLHSNVLAVPGVMAVALGLMIGAQSLFTSIRSGTRLSAANSVMLMVGGTMTVVIGIAVLEGGDHFAGFRMLQPYVPLICVALMFYVPLLAAKSALTANRVSGAVWCAGLIGVTLTANHSAFALMNRAEGVKEEFTIAQQGRRMGTLLNTIPASDNAPQPQVGVLPAGGIAVSYNGRVVDLLGLNWAEMAHASGRRKGLPGHSGFDLQVFWRHPPQIMLPRLTDAANPINEKQTPGHWEQSLLKGLLDQPRFREEYRPVFMRLGDGEIFAYARNDFLEQHQDDPRIVPMGWEHFKPASVAPSTERD